MNLVHQYETLEVDTYVELSLCSIEVYILYKISIAISLVTSYGH